MQADLLKNIVAEIAGAHASGLVDFLYGKKNVNEFLIAKKLKLTINQTRNVLYRLADEGVVSFIRKKDKKKGGWYTYFWTLNIGKGLFKLREHITRNIENLRNQLNLKKTERFYHCVNCNIESNEESALLHQYTCPECGEVLQLKDRGKEIEEMERTLAKFEEMFNVVNKEIETIVKKEEAVKARRNRAEARKKLKERALRKRKKELEMRRAKMKKKPKKAKKRTLSKFSKRLARLFRR